MIRKVIPIVVCLLFTFSFMSSALAAPQSLFWQLNQNKRAYIVPSYGKLDKETLSAIKACEKLCLVSKLDAKTCTMIDKALKGNEQSIK